MAQSVKTKIANSSSKWFLKNKSSSGGRDVAAVVEKGKMRIFHIYDISRRKNLEMSFFCCIFAENLKEP